MRTVAIAIFHAHAKVFSRAKGHSAVAAAAYRAGEKLHDERLNRAHDYRNKPGVVHKEIILPAGAPDAFADRGTLWRAVEAAEKRKDAQVAREIEVAIPAELPPEGRIDLVRLHASTAFVQRGMIADVCIHEAEPGKPHAHILLTMRAVGPDGFGSKAREWNDRNLLVEWREQWATLANQALAREGHAARIDHRSHQERGISLAPQDKIGRTSMKLEAEGKTGHRAAQHKRIAGLNGEKLERDPRIALDVLTEHQSTFTERDVAKLVHRCTNGEEQFRRVMAKIVGHEDLVWLGRDGRGDQRFSTRGMVEVEQAMAENARALAGQQRHGVARVVAERVLAGATLGPEQQEAFKRLVQRNGLGFVVGYAGTGKSRMLGAVREAYEAAGYRVRGAALAGIAAEGLEHGSGIKSRTIASYEWHWRRDRERLEARDVLVIDEAAMVGSRMLGRVLAEAKRAGAKVVLVGDPAQLQAIEAGAAMRSLMQEHGWSELTEVRRQRSDWMRQATKEFALGNVAQALARYDEAGMVHLSGTRDEARAKLIAQWDHDRQNGPNLSQMILAYTNAEVGVLNAMARERMRAAGQLGEDVTVQTTRGKRQFATGDRIMFLQNDPGLGVKNGKRGVIKGIVENRMIVQLDDGRKAGAGKLVGFDLGEYQAIEHGYAGTTHKMQGNEAGRVYTLLTPHFDRHSTYVAASRHTSRGDFHGAQEDFGSRERMARVLSRDGSKDTTLDWQKAQEQRRDQAVRSAVDAVRKEYRMAMKQGLAQERPNGQGAQAGKEAPGAATSREARMKLAIAREVERLKARDRSRDQSAEAGL